MNEAKQTDIFFSGAQESIKATQVIHRAVILLCGVIWLFAVSTRTQSTVFTDALSELKLIDKSLDRAGEINADQETQFYTDQGIKTIVQEEFKGVDLSKLEITGGRTQFSRPVYGAGDKAPLNEIHKYLVMKGNWEKLELYKINKDDLRNAARSFRKKFPSLQTLDYLFLLPEIPDGTDLALPAPDTGTLSVHIKEWENIDPDDSGKLISLNEADPSLKIHYSEMTLLPTTPSTDFLINLKLIVPKENSFEPDALPALRKVWDLVGTLDLEAAEASLTRSAKEEASRAEEDVSVFGMKLRSSNLVFTAPIILIVLMLYLYSHVVHLRALKISRFKALWSYPWMGLPTSKFAEILCATTVLIVPAASVGWLVMRSDLSMTEKSITAGIYSIIIFPLGYLIFSTIHQLRDGASIAEMIKPVWVPISAPADDSTVESLKPSVLEMEPKSS